jgi:hypothetical protein
MSAPYWVKEGGTFTVNKKGQLDSKEGEPAWVKPNGDKFWYREGWLHRDGGLPACEFADPSKPPVYYVMGRAVWPE